MERKFIITIIAAVLLILFVFVLGGCGRLESEEEVMVSAKVVENKLSQEESAIQDNTQDIKYEL